MENPHFEANPKTEIRRARVLSVLLVCLCFWLTAAKAAQSSVTSDYSAVDAIFAQHCLDCHGSKDPEGQLLLESFDSLMKGGEIGAAIVPGKSAESLLVQMIEGRFEKDGKKKIMPPGKREKLNATEIAAIKAWIDAGARAPARPIAKTLNVPKIEPRANPRNPINVAAWSSTGDLVAIGRYGEVELRSAADLHIFRTLNGHEGNVNALVFSTDGKELYTAGGQPGWSGEIRHWNVSEGKLLKVIPGHKDAIYAMALSPDGKTLATGSYDQKIKLWEIATGRELKTLSGHNGCVYGLAFRPDGKILASASADRTVKLWDAVSGERRETFSQSLKEVYAVAFSPDGKHLFAGGADNRIRVWQISESAAETTNPILFSKFGHEGAILRLAMSTDGKWLVSCADDRTVKLWDTEHMEQRFVFESQSDWPTATAFLEGDQVLIGRLDGTLSVYDSSTGKRSMVQAALAK